MAKVPMPEKSGSSLDGSDNRKKEVSKVTKGKVKTQEKSALKKFGEAFIEDDIADIKSYVISDVIIPAVKNLIFDSFIGSLEMMLFGSTGNRSRRSGGKNGSGTYVSYNKFSDNRSRRNDDSRSDSRLDYQSIIFEEKADAEEVLDTLRNLIEDYDQATIGDFYDAAGITPDKNFTKNEEYGWNDLNHASVKYGRDGWFISLPKERYLG